jgi:F0F1-type ATP synthase delta subunit
MSRVERWAEAFIGAFKSSGAEELDEGLAVLRIFAAQGEAIHGFLTGSSAAAQFDRMIALAGERSGTAGGRGFSLARRFIFLLIAKGEFKQIKRILSRVEEILDRRQGILAVRIDTAFPLDEDFQGSLKTALKEKFGVREIKFLIREVPELLGGCRLFVDGMLVDASLSSQLQQLALGLHAGTGALLNSGGM